MRETVNWKGLFNRNPGQPAWEVTARRIVALKQGVSLCWLLYQESFVLMAVFCAIYTKSKVVKGNRSWAEKSFLDFFFVNCIAFSSRPVIPCLLGKEFGSRGWILPGQLYYTFLWLHPQSCLLWLPLAVSLQAATWKLWCGGRLSLVPHLPLPAVVTYLPHTLCPLHFRGNLECSFLLN